MGAAPPATPLRALVVRKQGDPLETEQYESGPPAEDPVHLDLLNRIFYNSSVDLGAVVRVGTTSYICTRVGWRVYPA